MDRLNNLIPNEVNCEILSNLVAKDLWEVYKAHKGKDRSNIIYALNKLKADTFPSWPEPVDVKDEKQIVHVFNCLMLSSLELNHLETDYDEELPRLYTKLGLDKYDYIAAVSEINVHPVTKRHMVGITIRVPNFDNHEVDDDADDEVKHDEKTTSIGDGSVFYSTRIVLCEYPSWDVIKTIDINEEYELTHMLVDIQTIRAPAGHRTDSEYMTLLLLGYGGCEFGNYKEKNAYGALSCFWLHDNNHLLHVGNMEQDQDGVGFSDPAVLFYSQAHTDDGDSSAVERVEEWLPEICHDIEIEYDHTLFATLFQADDNIQLFKFDLKDSVDLGDQEKTTLNTLQLYTDFEAAKPFHEFDDSRTCETTLYIRPLRQLNHLVVGNGYTPNNEVHLYDWRFNVLAGVLPLDGVSKKQLYIGQSETDQEGDESPEVEVEWKSCRNVTVYDTLATDSADFDLRLTMFGFTSNGSRTLQTWDISYMLNVDYTPVKEKSDAENADLPYSPPKGSKSLVMHHELPPRDNGYEEIYFNMLGNAVVYSTNSAITFVDSSTGITLHECRLPGWESDEICILGNNDIFVYNGRETMYGVLR